MRQNVAGEELARYLERQGLLECDTGNIYLAPEALDASDEDHQIAWRLLPH